MLLQNATTIRICLIKNAAKLIFKTVIGITKCDNTGTTSQIHQIFCREGENREFKKQPRQGRPGWAGTQKCIYFFFIGNINIFESSWWFSWIHFICRCGQITTAEYAGKSVKPVIEKCMENSPRWFTLSMVISCCQGVRFRMFQGVLYKGSLNSIF